MNINLSEIISYVFLAAGLVSLVAGYLAKYDKKHAQLWNDLHNAATAIVAQQDTLDMSNETKKATATAELMNQMNALGHKHVDLPTAQGAIEQAVQDREPATKMSVNIDTKPLVDTINNLKEVK